MTTADNITYVTPWLDHLELLNDYAQATAGARIIIVDNASEEYTAQKLEQLAASRGNGSRYIRLDTNVGFGKACNIGIQAAQTDWIFCLNNDIVATGDWQTILRQSLQENALIGANIAAHVVDGIRIPYVEGWLVGASKSSWEALGGFDTQRCQFAYYEDADLSFRAMRFHKMRLIALAPPFPLKHLSNTTSKTTPGAYDYSLSNRKRFFDFVRQSLDLPDTRMVMHGGSEY